MSGGSMEYLYQKLDDVYVAETTPLRKAFVAHLKLVAKALHDVEWVDSCDYSPGQEEEAIRRVVTPTDELRAATADAVKAKAELEATLARFPHLEAPR